MPVRVFTETEKKEITIKMFEAGMGLIRTNGLTHTSVTKITQAAGIGKSTFYNFFTSKETFVIALIQYEREKTMKSIADMLGSRDKLSLDEAKQLLRQSIYSQDSIYQYLTEEDMQTLYPAMEKAGFIQSDLSSDTPEYLLSIFPHVRKGVDSRIFVNFLRILALTVTQKEAMHQDVLDKNIEMIFDTLFSYLFEM